MTADYSQWTFLVPLLPDDVPGGVEPHHFADEVRVAVGGLFPYADVRVAMFNGVGFPSVEVYDATGHRDPEVERMVDDVVVGLRSREYRRCKRFQYVGVN